MKDPIKFWKQLAGNVDEFFGARSQSLTCAQGCSKCCETPRSVFGIEAEVITQYIEALEEGPFSILKEKLAEIKAGGLDHCAFLKDGSCLVYEARHIICRSHGLFHLTKDGHHHCELNYTSELPLKSDWIDEERLVLLLAMLEREYENDARFPTRVSLSDLANTVI